MSISNLLVPNTYELFCESLTSPEFVKTNSINTTDPQRLSIGDNVFTFDGMDVGTTGSVATYTFNGIPFNPSGTVPVTLAPVGASPNANAATLTGQVLNLEPANATNPGVLTSGTQSIGGTKNFTSDITAANIQGVTSLSGATLVLPVTTSLSSGTIQQAAGVPLLHTAGTLSTFLGANAGNLASTSSSQTGVGAQALQSVTVGASGNSCFGYQSGRQITTGIRNTCIGSAAGAGLITGGDNVLIGQLAGVGGTTLSNAIIIGRSAGAALTTETNLIEICPDASLTAGAANSIKIGSTSSSYCEIRGIASASVSPNQMVVINSTTHQLGTVTYANSTTNFTVTLDAGSITSSTVRGASSAVVPITLNRQDAVVTMLIPSFVLTGQSAAASTINLTGVGVLPATYRPTYNLSFVCSTQDNASFVMGTIYVTSGGAVSWQVGPAFTLPSGSPYDLSFCWNIAP